MGLYPRIRRSDPGGIGCSGANALQALTKMRPKKVTHKDFVDKAEPSSVVSRSTRPRLRPLPDGRSCRLSSRGSARPTRASHPDTRKPR
jgi:hypothetical protein